MYMAIFFGGRWIRGEFRDAGEEFWNGGKKERHAHLFDRYDSALLLERKNWKKAGDDGWEEMEEEEEEEEEEDSLGFSFLSFDGERDGEDFRDEFLERLKEGEELLTEEERREVVDGAVEVFEMCIQLVDSLQSAMWWWRDLWKVGAVVIAFILIMRFVL